jgi:bacillopeptidase F
MRRCTLNYTLFAKALGLVAFLLVLLFGPERTSAGTLTAGVNLDSTAKKTYLLVFSSQWDARQAMLEFERLGTPLAERARLVLRNSQQQSQASLVQLNAWLKNHDTQANRILDTLWISNAVHIALDSSSAEALNRQPWVGQLLPASALPMGYTENSETAICEEMIEPEHTEAVNGREPGLTTIQAPLLWARGYTGKGRRALLMDTGVWPQHPALRGKFLGYRLGLDQAWLAYDEPMPADKSGNHGTHVVGTILGLDTATKDTIGAAFGAYYLATDPIVTNLALVRSWTQLMQAFQWALNPDGDTSTTNDIPDVINNSWGRANAGFDSVCQAPVVAQALLAVEAAGIANVFSAGNNGPGAYTMGVPAQVVYDTLNVFSVGALEPTNALAGFSSNGPSRCGTDSLGIIKPEVSAPGVNIRSADGPAGYGQKSGTSMASPHVSGAVLLLKEAFPQVSGRQILNALYQTAMDLGPAGEDHLFGRGLIQTDAAFQFLASRYAVQPPQHAGPDLAILGLDSPLANQLGLRCTPNSSDSIPLRLRVRNQGDTAVQGFYLDLYDQRTWRRSVYFGNITLQQGQSTTLSLMSLPRNPNRNTENWMFRLKRIPSSSLVGTENDTINNYFALSFSNITPAQDLLTEHFDDSLRLPFVTENHRTRDWVIENPDNDDYSANGLPATWAIYRLPSTPAPPHPAGTGSLGMGSGWAAGIKMRDYSSRLRQKDHLISPPFFKSAAPWGQSYRLSFDVAYANRNSTFRDSLWVELSDNCGQNYRIIYRNGGDSLRSHALINPADSSAFRRIFVDDSLLQQNISGSYRLRFTSLNDFGGNLYVTNIALYRVFAASSSNLGDSDARKSRWIYPNPSQTRELNYRTGSEVKGVRLTLINATGQTLWTSEITESLQGPDFRWELPNLDKGIYTVLMDEFNYHNLTTPRSFRFRLVHATP